MLQHNRGLEVQIKLEWRNILMKIRNGVQGRVKHPEHVCTYHCNVNNNLFVLWLVTCCWGYAPITWGSSTNAQLLLLSLSCHICTAGKSRQGDGTHSPYSMQEALSQAYGLMLSEECVGQSLQIQSTAVAFPWSPGTRTKLCALHLPFMQPMSVA
jgi:hypothetical protein